MARQTLTKALAAVTAGALLLAGCGGGDGDSRTRNQALEAPAECFTDQAAKNAAVAAARATVAQIEALRPDRDDAWRAYQAAASRAQVAFDALRALDPPAEASAEEIADASSLRAEALQAADAAYAAWEDLDSQLTQLRVYQSQLESAEATPLCDTSDGAVSPETSTAIDDTQAATTSSTSSVAGDVSAGGDATETTTADTTPAMPEEDPVNPPNACPPPVPEGTVDTVIDAGTTIAFKFTNCRPGTTVGVSSNNWPSSVMVGHDISNPQFIVHDIQFPNVGTVTLQFWSAASASGPVNSDPYTMTFTVRDAGATAPCAGRAPEGTWDANLDGGTFVATSTCEGYDTLYVSVFSLDGEELKSRFKGYLVSAAAQTDLIQMFGSGTYQVYLSHLRLNENDDWALIGDLTVIDVIYRAPEPQPGVVSNAPVEGVSRLPLPALTPVATDTPVAPADAGSTVGAVALPADTTLLVCDEKCIADVLSRAGTQTGTVEIKIGDAPWQEVKGSIAVPAGSTALRVRAVPEAGEAVEYAAVVTRDDLNTVYAASVSGEVRTEVAGVGDSSDDGSAAFPWWIVGALVVLLAVGGYAGLRRRGVKEQSAN